MSLTSAIVSIIAPGPNRGNQPSASKSHPPRGRYRSIRERTSPTKRPIAFPRKAHSADFQESAHNGQDSLPNILQENALRKATEHRTTAHRWRTNSAPTAHRKRTKSAHSRPQSEPRSATRGPARHLGREQGPIPARPTFTGRRPAHLESTKCPKTHGVKMLRNRTAQSPAAHRRRTRLRIHVQPVAGSAQQLSEFITPRPPWSRRLRDQSIRLTHADLPGGMIVDSFDLIGASRE